MGAKSVSEISRRGVLAGAGAATALAAAGRVGVASAGVETIQADAAPANSASLKFLDSAPLASGTGVTFGLPWPKGALTKETQFSLGADGGGGIPVQSWPTAYWPDGSLKWTAHAATVSAAKSFTLKHGDAPESPKSTIVITDAANEITINTGALTTTLPKSGTTLVSSLSIDGRQKLTHGRLVLTLQDAPAPDDAGKLTRTNFAGTIEKVTVEQSGPIRAVVKIEGSHSDGTRKALPFAVRLYFYAGSAEVKLTHTFTYDLDDQKDFIAALGLRFDVPMTDDAFNRHVRFVGKDGGVWAEAVQGLTGLRRDPGGNIRAEQWNGRKAPEPAAWSGRPAADRVQYIPVWGDFSLRQLSADGFDIRKRTKPGHAWIASAADTRAAGTAYVGGASGGVAFGLRDFWQRHPTALDVRNAHTSAATTTIWFYSPDAPAMDVRFYHDGMGQDTHRKQYDGGLEITYEDYEPGYGTAVGVARTSEVTLLPLATTPSREALAAFATTVSHPPLLVSTPDTYRAAGVFGGLWTPVDTSTPSKAKVEAKLDFLINYYLKEVEQRHWYGFWDFGDIMHTYDDDRHCWRYDVGGFAWDNSELSPDLWIWMSFLRTGRADIFRFAEAMIKHTTDVDSYHAGPFKLLGTRHGVQHWGDSAKQLRISTAIYRRFYYYLTANERIGDCLTALRDADTTFLTTDPGRKLRRDGDPYKPEPHALAVGLGTDWGSLAGAFLTEYERTLDEKIKAKLLNNMKSIGQMPHGFFSGGGKYDLDTGIFTKNNDGVEGSHLMAAFGLPEICAELIQNFDVPEFEKAWLQYAHHYNTPRAERQKLLGFDEKNGILVDGHARGTAWAAVQLKDEALAKRAWHELLSGNVDPRAPISWPAANGTTPVLPPNVLKPIQEAKLSTNGIAQWGTAAIELLALIPESIPDM